MRQIWEQIIIWTSLVAQVKIKDWYVESYIRELISFM